MLKFSNILITILFFNLIIFIPSKVIAKNRKLKVITTLPDYANIAKEIGGKHVIVKHIVNGNQDAHFIRPKPSFISMLKNADILITTGLDLEMWLPGVINKSGNKKIQSGARGYISAAAGLKLLEKPELMSRSEGGLHVYGNPHITTSPLNMLHSAKNIAAGFIKNNRKNENEYKQNLEVFKNKIYTKLFGKEIVSILGGDIAARLAKSNKLINFLEKKEFQGKKLIYKLSGWMGKLYKLKNIKIVCYHKNWAYFSNLFNLKIIGYIEPKPGIPPSPRHLKELKQLMKKEKVKLILAASYFNKKIANSLARQVNAKAVILPYYVKGKKSIKSYIQLIDYWINNITENI